MVTIERYKRTRFWAVYDGTELVCVTVYKRGAVNVRDRLMPLTTEEQPRVATYIPPDEAPPVSHLI